MESSIFKGTRDKEKTSSVVKRSTWVTWLAQAAAFYSRFFRVKKTDVQTPEKTYFFMFLGIPKHNVLIIDEHMNSQIGKQQI